MKSAIAILHIYEEYTVNISMQLMIKTVQYKKGRAYYAGIGITVL